MNPEFAVELLKMMMYYAVLLAAPLLMTGMLIGLGVSLFQTITSISEQTLAFVPKALGVIAVMILLLPWMLRMLISFSTSIIEKMPQMVK